MNKVKLLEILLCLNLLTLGLALHLPHQTEGDDAIKDILQKEEQMNTTLSSAEERIKFMEEIIKNNTKQDEHYYDSISLFEVEQYLHQP